MKREKSPPCEGGPRREYMQSIADHCALPRQELLFPPDPPDVTRGPFARRDHPETAKRARDEIRPHVTGLRRRVLDCICAFGPGGATDDQIQDHTGILLQTEIPRRRELVELGLVKNSGQRRKTRSGRNAILWVTTDCTIQSLRPSFCAGLPVIQAQETAGTKGIGVGERSGTVPDSGRPT